MIKLTPIRRALKAREILHENHFTEKRWNTSAQMGYKIEQNNKQLCKELNDFYRDVCEDGSKFYIINGKLHLISSSDVKEIDDLVAKQLIQDMRQNNKDGHFNISI
jgi:hypothetical protein